MQLSDPHREVGMTNFYFAYQGVNDVELQALTAKFYLRACPKLAWTAPHCSAPGQLPDGRLRIGFVSSSLFEHTIGKFYHGIIAEALARTLRGGGDAAAARHATRLAMRSGATPIGQVEIPYDLYPARDASRRERLDILFYPDLGMTPLTYFLAFARLAPVQCVSWGHPVTTGIPAIDYFISRKKHRARGCADALLGAADFARPAADLLLAAASCCDSVYARGAGISRRRQALRVSAESVQAASRLRVVLATLLRRDPKARLLLLSGVHKHWDRLLAARIAKGFPDVAERVIFVPRIPHAQFFRLLMMADVILDPPFFGGGNTSYEAFAMGLPIVTWPGPFMRGRVTEGCYRQMVWACTTCGWCETRVPGVHRERAPAHRHAPLSSAGASRTSPGDPARLRGHGDAGQPLGGGAGQAGRVGGGPRTLPAGDGPGKYEYLFFVGCAGSYDDRQKKVSRALVRILREARPQVRHPRQAGDAATATRPGGWATSTSTRRSPKTNVETFNGLRGQGGHHPVPPLLQHHQERVPGSSGATTASSTTPS